MLLARPIALLGLVLSVPAFAERMTTREALERFEEVVAMRIEDSDFDPKEVLPALVVSVTPAFDESQAWYPTAALASLTRVFGAAGLRFCAACMAPRVFVERGRLEQTNGPIALDEIIRLDEGLRGTASAARAAIWLDESAEGVAVRAIDLRTGRIILAENFDPMLTGKARTQNSFRLARELDRRARGDSLTQLYFDSVLYPHQHISFDWAEQWGDTNANISGVTLSVVDPLLGVGGAYYRVIPEAYNLMVGGQILVSLPTAVIQAVGGGDLGFPGDNLLTLAGVIRVPFGSSNYGVVASLSTNGRVGIGLSLMNISFLPVLP